MTTTAVRDKKIKLTERRITDAEKSKTQHQNHIQRLDREINAHKATLDWLKAMPVDDALADPPVEMATVEPNEIVPTRKGH